jgi:hypothetical protein
MSKLKEFSFFTNKTKKISKNLQIVLVDVGDGLGVPDGDEVARRRLHLAQPGVDLMKPFTSKSR